MLEDLHPFLAEIAYEFLVHDLGMKSYSFPDRKIALFTAYLFCGKPANICIGAVLNVCKIEVPQGENIGGGLENGGRLIGICVRVISITLVLSGQYAAVGFLITAKSILRYPSEKQNEYILIGTLLSFGIVFILGALLVTPVLRPWLCSLMIEDAPSLTLAFF